MGLTVRGLSPARLEHVQVATADTAVRDLNVDIVLCPLLGLKVAPLHLSIDRLGRLSEPSLESWASHC